MRIAAAAHVRARTGALISLVAVLAALAGEVGRQRTWVGITRDTLGYMSDPKAVQRSFRLSARTLELLDDAAAGSQESRNALTDRLLGEALRLERHALIRFHAGAAGRRQPRVTGTRLDVHQMVATLRANDGDMDAAGEYLGVDSRLVRAALEYYAEFTHEVDADAEAAAEVAEAERARWERAQRAVH